MKELFIDCSIVTVLCCAVRDVSIDRVVIAFSSLVSQVERDLKALIEKDAETSREKAAIFAAEIILSQQIRIECSC